MNYLGSNIYTTTHLWSFCYLDEKGELKAIELERLDRYKNSPNLSSFSLIPKVEDYYKQKIFDYFNITGNYKSLNFDTSNILEKHHYLHACSVYYSNDLRNATILCMDRNGYDSDLGNQFQTIWKGENMSVDFKYSTEINSQLDRGIGFAYYIISEFLRLGEGSVMGLSAYGDKEFYKDIELYEYRDHGVYFNKCFLKNTIFNEVGDMDFFKEYDIFDEANGNREIILKNIKNIFGITDEDLDLAEKDIVNSNFAHISALLQYQTEEAILYLAKKAYKICPSKNLCLAGGVALNILANTRILKETEFERVYISPVSEDIGLALGAFYHLYHVQEKESKRVFLESTGYGKIYSKKDILKSLKEFGAHVKYKYLRDDEIYEHVTDKLIENKVLGWFQGASEFGPRSLGNRSIIASPSSIELRDKVNNIKSRELWRPVAPSILEEDIGNYFDIDYKSAFMSFSGNIKKHEIENIKGVVHIDNTSRYQSVSKNNNLKYYNLIKKFKEKTGISIITNTSMNVSLEPIIESPKDAFKMFLSTQLDYLVIDNFFIEKNKNENNFKFNYENVRLKRNLLFIENKENIENRKKINDEFKKIFKGYDFKLNTHFYDENLSFLLNGEKYILEDFSKFNNYLFTNKKTGLIKLGKYSLFDEKVINILFNKSLILSFFKDKNYILNDY